MLCCLPTHTGRTHDSYYLVVDGVGLEAPIQLVRDTTNRKVLWYIITCVDDMHGIVYPHHLTLHFIFHKHFLQKLRHLAHKIAANLTINYFDIHDSSKHRIHALLL